MSKKQIERTIGKRILLFIDLHMTAIVYVALVSVAAGILLWIFYGKNIIAFFQPTPQHKCEASLPSYAENLYCKEDGTQGNKKEDECLAKGSNYEYDSSTFQCNKTTTSPSRIDAQHNTSKMSYTCEDVTSYDYDWDNDMLCTSSNGKQFYTSYEHAQLLMNGDLSEQYENMGNYDYYDYYDEY